MNPGEWNASQNKSHLYREVMRRSTERFFVCESRFGTFKVRSALENVFVLMAHDCDCVRSLSYEKIRVPLGSRTHIPDFLVNDEHLIECKARKDWHRKPVADKAAAAYRYASDRDWLYHMLDFEQFSEFFELLC